MERPSAGLEASEPGVSEGAGGPAFPPPPPPALTGGPGVCAATTVGAASGPSAWGSGHIQGQAWMLSLRPPTSKDSPCRPRPPAPSLGGSSFSCRILGPHYPNLSPGARKGPPRQGDSTWDQHPRPSIRPVESGPWNGEPAAADEVVISLLSPFARTAPLMAPHFRHRQDERGRKSDSTDQAPGPAKFFSSFFLSSFLAAFRVAGFPGLSWSPRAALCPRRARRWAREGRDVPGLPSECEGPFQDLWDWLGLPEGEPKAGPPLTSALP